MGRGVEGGIGAWAWHGKKAYQSEGTTLARGGRQTRNSLSKA